MRYIMKSNLVIPANIISLCSNTLCTLGKVYYVALFLMYI